MRFSTILIGAFAAIATAQSTTAAATTTTGVATTSVSISPAQASAAKCIEACEAGDVDCQAHCITVPSPDGAQVNATTDCVAACPQGNGTAADNADYADCVNNCIGAHYYTSTVGTPETTIAAGGSNGNGNGNGNGQTTATGTGTDKGTATATGTGKATATGDATGEASGSAKATDASGSATATGSSTASGSAASASSSSGAADVVRMGTSVVGLCGFMAALLTL